MRLRLAIFAAFMALLAIPFAGWSEPTSTGEPEETPTLRDPLPFEHREHADVFLDHEVGCITCHPIGMYMKVDSARKDVGVWTPPLSVCHGCHRGMVPRAPRDAPSDCMLCHADREELRPVGHNFDWIKGHGPEARAPGSLCASCHETSMCVDCHDRRGAVVRQPHAPGFRSFHGIEARIDPRSCSTCHTGTFCVECHEGASVPW